MESGELVLPRPRASFCDWLREAALCFYRNFSKRFGKACVSCRVWPLVCQQRVTWQSLPCLFKFSGTAPPHSHPWLLHLTRFQSPKFDGSGRSHPPQLNGCSHTEADPRSSLLHRFLPPLLFLKTPDFQRWSPCPAKAPRPLPQGSRAPCLSSLPK